MKIFSLLLALSTLIFAHQGQTNSSARFDWFAYEGLDEVFTTKLKKGNYFNPIIAGYYPDPSIVRVESNYYLVNSSFAYFPGLPVFHSKDLVHWQQIGNALNRRSQLTFEKGQAISHGIFAPTLRYHDGLFYIITTDVNGIGNFYITASDPAGPWSDPIVLPEIGGIDPDLFFDDDGRVYIAHNEGPEGEPLYNGHRAIWLWEFDLKHKKVIKNSGRVIVNGGADITKNPIWIEGPHIYKVNGWYYLICAEGGTGDDHSEVIFRTKNLTDKFVPFEGNPILTQRDLPNSRTNPITSTGHADLVQTPAGDWWAVFLGIRPYFDKEDNVWYHNTGRETFLLPVQWREGWPQILPAKTVLPQQLPAPKLEAGNTENIPPQSGNFRWRDDFNSSELLHTWVKARSSKIQWHSIDTQKNQLNLQAQGFTLSDKVQPSFLARRQQHQSYRATTHLQTLDNEKLSAGIAAFQNSDFHYFLGARKHGNSLELFLEETIAGTTNTLKTLKIKTSKQGLILGVEQKEAKLRFFYIDAAKREHTVMSGLKARNISTQKAGGFVGVMLGLHARSEK